MTAHELARKLLEGPDDPVLATVYMSFMYGPVSISDQTRVIKLRRPDRWSTLNLDKPWAGETPAVILHVHPED